MHTHYILLLLLLVRHFHSQSLTFGPATTLFNLDPAHWGLSQPMIPVVGADGKQVDFKESTRYRVYGTSCKLAPAEVYKIYGEEVNNSIDKYFAEYNARIEEVNYAEVMPRLFLKDFIDSVL